MVGTTMMDFKKWRSADSPVCAELRNEHNDAIDEIERLKAENKKLESDLLNEQAQKVDWDRINKQQELYERGDELYAIRDELKEIIDKTNIKEAMAIRDMLSKMNIK